MVMMTSDYIIVVTVDAMLRTAMLEVTDMRRACVSQHLSLTDVTTHLLLLTKRGRRPAHNSFADMGLMALLCRHDRPLWTINMTSAGEKQHYAVALLRRLFEHIPKDMTVGVLYDIGCQLHRSCEKWGFLQEFLPRITFGISVFHAYGHQWPCQIVYHPRKCCGFGLTDGEGCERFWSFLKKLIPGLRVSGVGSYSCSVLLF